MTDVSARLELTLAAGCRLRTETTHGPVLDTADGVVRLTPDAGTTQERALATRVVRRLRAGGASEASLVADVTETGGYAGLRCLYGVLHALHQRLLLGRTVSTAAGPLLTGWPLNARSPFAVGGVAAGRRWRLSRFASARRVGDCLMLESPRAPLRVTLHGAPAMRLLAQLVQPCTAATLAEGGDLDHEAAHGCLDLLGHGRLVVAVDGDDATDEDVAPLGAWQHHDLLFHARSRFGSHVGGYGGTRRFEGREPQPPALEPEPSSPSIELHRPDPVALAQNDPPLARVIGERRSWRRHADPAMDQRQLGELLFRTARVVDGREGETGDLARRPYPSGGGSYELEVYPVIGACRGLAPGLYRYLPARHRLAPVCGTTPDVETLLSNAGHIARMTGPVQTLLVLAARFRRVSWKYESMAYATVLKDVGVVYQTVYLAATAMGLGACALGGGDSGTFARACGLDPYDQTSVGEILVGSRP